MPNWDKNGKAAPAIKKSYDSISIPALEAAAIQARDKLVINYIGSALDVSDQWQ
jgi:hypothetical protein